MPALEPKAVLLEPVLFASARKPSAVLKLPVVLRSAPKPVAVLLFPVLQLKSALTPLAVLKLPLALLLSASKPMAVLLFASCELQERIIALSCVVVGIASVRWRGNRVGCRRERKQYEHDHQ